MALSYVRQDFNAHQATHGVDINKYKQVTLSMAKARRFVDLGELLPMPLPPVFSQAAPAPPVMQAALPAPTQPSCSMAVQAPQATIQQSTTSAPQATTKKVKAKLQTQLSRRKSMRQLEKHSKAHAEATTREAFLESTNVKDLLKSLRHWLETSTKQ